MILLEFYALVDSAEHNSINYIRGAKIHKRPAPTPRLGRKLASHRPGAHHNTGLERRGNY